MPGRETRRAASDQATWSSARRRSAVARGGSSSLTRLPPPQALPTTAISPSGPVRGRAEHASSLASWIARWPGRVRSAWPTTRVRAESAPQRAKMRHEPNSRCAGARLPGFRRFTARRRSRPLPAAFIQWSPDGSGSRSGARTGAGGYESPVRSGLPLTAGARAAPAAQDGTCRCRRWHEDPAEDGVVVREGLRGTEMRRATARRPPIPSGAFCVDQTSFIGASYRYS